MANKKILVVGSVTMELSMNMYKVPNAGETLIDDGGVAYMFGGKGTNAAIAMKKFGADPVFCGKLGADLHGEKIYQYCRELHVDTSYLKVDRDTPTGLSVVMKESNGNSRVVAYPGANNNLTQENILKAFESNPDALYLSFELPFNVVSYAAKIASERGIPIFLDAVSVNKDYPIENLPALEVFMTNEKETEVFTGVLPNGNDAAQRALFLLQKRVKAKYVIIKRGNRGAFLSDGKHFTFISALSMKVHKDGKQEVLDPSASSDAFSAALTVDYLRNASIKNATKYGVAASAITVTRVGSASSIPTDAEIRELINKEDLI